MSSTFSIIEQITTYGENLLSSKPHATQLLRHLLKEALPLLPPDEISKKDIDINPLENLTAAINTLLGPTIISVLKNPQTWGDLVNSIGQHPLLDGWILKKYPSGKIYWPNDTPTRLLWHVKSGFICASKNHTLQPNIFISLLENPDVKIFPWRKQNFITLPNQ